MPRRRFKLVADAECAPQIKSTKKDSDGVAGHDRCLIPIRPENLDKWVNRT
jgi:hypothetical protein